MHKAFVPVLGRPLITHTLTVFQESPEVAEIVLVVLSQDLSRAKQLVSDYGFTKVRSIQVGGETRRDSVRNGLSQISSDCEIVVIHDGARPLVHHDVIAASIEAAKVDGAAIAAVPVIDTIKSSHDGQYVSETLERDRLYAVQTPQTFKREIIQQAYEQAYADGYMGTDDASLVERLGFPVRIVRGSYDNIKVTTPTDLVIAESLLAKRCAQSLTFPENDTEEQDTYTSFPVENPRFDFRVGYGYDIHRFGLGRRLFLGGIEFEGEEGLVGHSDADVILHAISDAILGAIGAGDIGRLFPDTDPSYKDIRSTILLARVSELAARLGWCVGNVDLTLIAQHPRIAPRISSMCSTIADTLQIKPDKVNIKATTAEGLGPVGQRLGAECHAVVTVFRVKQDVNIGPSE